MIEISAELAIPSVVLVLIALAARWVHGNWLAPGAAFAAVWSLLLWMSLLSPLWGAPSYPVWTGGVWWIVASTLAFVLGSVVGHAPRRWPAETGEPNRPLFLPHMPAIIVISTVVGFIYTAIYFSGETDPRTIVQIILVPQFTGPMIGAAYFGSTRGRKRYLGLLTLAPGLFTGLLSSGRTAFMAPVVWWGAGAFAFSVFLGGSKLKVITLKRTTLGAAFVLAALLMGAVFQIFRSVSVPRLNVSERLSEYTKVLSTGEVTDAWIWMQSSYFGHISAFSAWFESAWVNPPPLALGSQSMNGLFRLLDLPIAETDYVLVDGISTNVFTLFKPPIGDFGFAGALLFFLLMGWTTGFSYRRLRDGQLWPLSILAGFYVHCILAGGWFFNYNSVTASYFVPCFYFLWLQRRRTRTASNAGWRRGVLRAKHPFFAGRFPPPAGCDVSERR
jgi:oligosaccharide repeat unit polymerase